jgi:hypothetical protein
VTLTPGGCAITVSCREHRMTSLFLSISSLLLLLAMRVSIAVNRGSDPTSSSVISEVLPSASFVLWSCCFVLWNWFCCRQVSMVALSVVSSLYKSWERGSQTAEPSACSTSRSFQFVCFGWPRERYAAASAAGPGGGAPCALRRSLWIRWGKASMTGWSYSTDWWWDTMIHGACRSDLTQHWLGYLGLNSRLLSLSSKNKNSHTSPQTTGQVGWLNEYVHASPTE